MGSDGTGFWCDYDKFIVWCTLQSFFSELFYPELHEYTHIREFDRGDFSYSDINKNDESESLCCKVSYDEILFEFHIVFDNNEEIVHIELKNNDTNTEEIRERLAELFESKLLSKNIYYVRRNICNIIQRYCQSQINYKCIPEYEDKADDIQYIVEEVESEKWDLFHYYDTESIGSECPIMDYSNDDDDDDSIFLNLIWEKIEGIEMVFDTFYNLRYIFSEYKNEIVTCERQLWT